MSKVSIVVPIYNVENYLEKCINSIINQTYKNLEIILVDDGSTDSSGRICDDYKKKDKRIKVIHKTNGGLSDARNSGLKIASGEYICFFDSDDYVELNIIERMYESCVRTNSDICCCGKIIEKGNQKIIKNNNVFFVCESKEALKHLLTLDDIETSAWDKLYKKDLFENIEYPYGKIYEDMGTTYKILFKAKCICHITDPLYHYLVRNGSISNTSFNEKHLQLLIYSNEIKDFISQQYPDLNEAANNYYYLQLIVVLQKIKMSTNYKDYVSLYKKIKKEFNKNMIGMLKNQYLPFIKKLVVILLFLNQYKMLHFIKKFLKH